MRLLRGVRFVLSYPSFARWTPFFGNFSLYMYLNSYNHLIQVSYWSRVVYEWSLVISFARVYIFCCLAISGAPKPNTGCGHRGHDTPQNKHQCREYHKYTLGMGTGADILPGGVSFQSQCLSWNTQLPDDSCECA